MSWRLAQINLAHMKGPLESEVMTGFRTQLDRINALADASPGFVWRLQGEDGADATSIRAFDDPLLLVNMSVWESLEALHGYVYKSGHVALLRGRREWFHPFQGPALALWWIETGHVPTLEEGKAKLELVTRLGPTPSAFSFRQPFPPPGRAGFSPPEVDAEFCRA